MVVKIVSCGTFVFINCNGVGGMFFSYTTPITGISILKIPSLNTLDALINSVLLSLDLNMG